MRRLCVFLLIAFLSGCKYLQPKQEHPNKVVATVGDISLLERNLKDLIPHNSSPNDSVIFTEKFIEDWVTKQLMIGKAKEEINFNEAKIQQKVLNYQYALMVHELEKKFIHANLDTEVDPMEIKQYYEQKSENFILRQNIAKCLYYKIPSSSPNIKSFKRYLKNYPKDRDHVKKYANQFAITAFSERSLWVRFGEILKETPLRETSNESEFLKRNSWIETSDEKFTYFINVFEYKIVGEIAPLEFVRENVKDIIVNKRKIALKKELEKKIYEEAEETNAFQVFTD